MRRMYLKGEDEESKSERLREEEEDFEEEDGLEDEEACQMIQWSQNLNIDDI